MLLPVFMKFFVLRRVSYWYWLEANKDANAAALFASTLVLASLYFYLAE